MNSPVLAVSAVVLWNGHLLLVRRGRGPAAGTWSVPGGKVEQGELLAQAVVREVQEETGLEVVCDERLDVVERFDGDHHHVIISHAATPLDPEAPIVAGDDASEAMWVPLSEVADLALVDGLAEFLHEHGVLTTIA